jgi:uncharacterized protein
MEGAMIISNTTPLINFAEIGRMDLLEALFGVLVIPPAVESELALKTATFPQAGKVPTLSFIRCQAPADQLLTASFASQVHRGESECLTLAMEHPGSLLLLDDVAARALAAANNRCSSAHSAARPPPNSAAWSPK